MLDDFLILIGRFHPLIVHLPIGFVVLGILIELNKKKFGWSNGALKFIFFWASITGVFSIISGFFQYQNGGYLWETIQNHFISGVLTTILSFSFYLKLIEYSIFKSIPRKLFTIANSFILIITGHLGGNITHGEEHLVEPLNNLIGIDEEETITIKYYEDFEEKPLFSSLIRPIIDEKCVKCHNSKKSNGKLKMHNSKELMKGGKNGSIINHDTPEMSEIYIRIHLPKEEKKHMPPKSGKQLTRQEINLISRWIKNGSSFEKSINDFKLEENLINYFFATEKPFFPLIEVSAPDNESIRKIRENKITINPINKNSNFLKVSSINNLDFNNYDISLLSDIIKNIVTLDLSDSKITDSIFSQLKYFTNLTVLKLNNTTITGKKINQLIELKNLKRIYLVNTNFKDEYINIFTQFKNLQKVYLYNEKDNFQNLDRHSKFDNKIFEFGYYSLEN
ncbi:MAG: hypothetical protein CMC11_05970 [Flavobacteriaceae bacterium]|nr:hypothetical protein [Flavobacteriaceae bacterium]